MIQFTSTRAGRAARTLLVLILLMLALVPAAALAVPSMVPTIDIADARTLPPGTTVTVKGSVTVPSGVYSSSTGDQGFAIQDHTGGIYVSIATNLGLAPRRQVRVTGEVANISGQLTLVVDSPADVKELGKGPKVHPQSFDTGEISEATEGLLVTVEGTITQPVIDDSPYGYKVFIDDGSGETQVFVAVSTGIDVSELAVGDQIRATGYSGEFDGQYEVLPRGPSDLIEL